MIMIFVENTDVVQTGWTLNIELLFYT